MVGNSVGNVVSDGATVLAVDDDPLVRKMLVRALERDGNRTIEAMDGVEGPAILLLQSIEDGRAAGDDDAVRRAAHTLKSQAAVFGADDLEEACRVLEHSAGAHRIDAAEVAAVLGGADAVGGAIRTLGADAG